MKSLTKRALLGPKIPSYWVTMKFTNLPPVRYFTKLEIPKQETLVGKEDRFKDYSILKATSPNHLFKKWIIYTYTYIYISCIDYLFFVKKLSNHLQHQITPKTLPKTKNPHHPCWEVIPSWLNFLNCPMLVSRHDEATGRSQAWNILGPGALDRENGGARGSNYGDRWHCFFSGTWKSGEWQVLCVAHV